MNSLILVIGTFTLLGSALVGGVFFAFSSFVMKSLARLPSSEGIAAMQSINVVVINWSFLGTFMGTALLSVGVFALMIANSNHPAAMFFIIGAILYFVGTFLVTVFGNVPLNNQLAAVTATGSAAASIWEGYLNRWTIWNHIRTTSAMTAAFMFSLGLINNGSA